MMAQPLRPRTAATQEGRATTTASTTEVQGDDDRFDHGGPGKSDDDRFDQGRATTTASTTGSISRDSTVAIMATMMPGRRGAGTSKMFSYTFVVHKNQAGKTAATALPSTFLPQPGQRVLFKNLRLASPHTTEQWDMQGVQAVVEEISVTGARVLIASGIYRGRRIIDLDLRGMEVQGQERSAQRGQGMKGESKPRSKAAVPTNAAAAARPQVVRERYDQHRAHRPGLRDRALREALIVDDHQEEIDVNQEEHDMEQGSDCTEELDVDDMDWRPTCTSIWPGPIASCTSCTTRLSTSMDGHSGSTDCGGQQHAKLPVAVAVRERMARTTTDLGGHDPYFHRPGRA